MWKFARKNLVQNAQFFLIIWRFPFPDAKALSSGVKFIG
jgi:hypothetical protein